MVRLINNRITNNNRLTQALRRSNQQLAVSKRQLEKLSTTDPLTGCFNRRELQRRLDEEIRRSGRAGTALSCLCIDIDHFKEVNDTFGHPSGDEVLRRVAVSLGGRIRSTDCLCRSGGEEFTLLLSCCNATAAIAMAEQLRLAIAAVEIPTAAGMISVTISLGVTGYRPGRDDAESLLSRADRALYQAKALGRNRVERL
jgi:diguanylate cyclase (GGDEF)-like protein